MTSGVTDIPRSGRLPAAGRPPAAGELAWHALSANQVLHSIILSARHRNGAEPNAGSPLNPHQIAKITAVGTQASGPHNAEDTGVSLIPRGPTRCLAPLIEWIIRASNPPYPPGCLGRDSVAAQHLDRPAGHADRVARSDHGHALG